MGRGASIVGARDLVHELISDLLSVEDNVELCMPVLTK